MLILGVYALNELNNKKIQKNKPTTTAVLRATKITQQKKHKCYKKL